jgi:pimeloyl-ACP methyl ester carboxylesterase
MNTTLPHLVLLHDALGASDQLAPLAAALESHFQVLQVEFHGPGTTAQQPRPFRMEQFVENVLAAMAERGIERASLFGYSVGGYVALLVAAAEQARVERVITLGTKFRWDPATAADDGPRLSDEVLRSIRVPVTVTVGGRDNTVSVEESRNVARKLRQGTLMVLENTTHPIEQVPVEAIAEVITTAA